MLSLLLTIACSTSIALLLKYNHTRDGNALVLLAGNYLVATLISAGFWLGDAQATASPEAAGFGALLAVLFVVSFFAFTHAVRIAGTALASVTSRLSVIFPVLLSMLIFAERPGGWQMAGFALALITLLLFYRSLHSGRVEKLPLRDYLFLAVLLVGIGINDFSMKIFQQWRPGSEKPFFLLMIFSGALIYCLAIIRIRRIPLRRDTILLGLLLGIPNIFSSYFLIGALESMEAIIVYPVVNIGIILATAVLAALIWREKLNRAGQLALLTGSLAIVLLGL